MGDVMSPYVQLSSFAPFNRGCNIQPVGEEHRRWSVLSLGLPTNLPMPEKKDVKIVWRNQYPHKSSLSCQKLELDRLESRFV